MVVRQKLLQRTDCSFQNRNSAVLADRAKPRLDVLLFAPALVTRGGPKLTTFIANQVFGWHPRSVNHPSQKRPHLDRCRRTPEHGEPHDPPRMMVEHERQPPAERPALRQRPRQP